MNRVIAVLMPLIMIPALLGGCATPIAISSNTSSATSPEDKSLSGVLIWGHEVHDFSSSDRMIAPLLQY